MFNIDKFTVDMDKLLSKYKIKSGAFVSEHDNKIIAFTKLRKSTIKKETELADALIDLFCEINLDIEDIKGITKLVQFAKEQTEIDNAIKTIDNAIKTLDTITKREEENLAFLKLSDENKMLVEDIREKKTSAIKNKRYEEACKWREAELKILNKK